MPECWHRAAIQQATGIAKSWRTNREQAYRDYLEELEEYQKQKENGELDAQAKEPIWTEWDIPTLRQVYIQANVNIAKLEASEDSSFDYWLRISTLELYKPLPVPSKVEVIDNYTSDFSHRANFSGLSPQGYRRASSWRRLISTARPATIR